MKINETAITQTQNLKENGEVNYSFFSQPIFNSTSFSLSVGVNFYKNNKEQFEKDLINFIQYAILGYTSDNSIEIEETEQEVIQEKEYITESDIKEDSNNTEE